MDISKPVMRLKVQQMHALDLCVRVIVAHIDKGGETGRDRHSTAMYMGRKSRMLPYRYRRDAALVKALSGC
jgi:hypothetical protein